jgi:hypothetical protein
MKHELLPNRRQTKRAIKLLPSLFAPRGPNSAPEQERQDQHGEGVQHRL